MPVPGATHKAPALRKSNWGYRLRGHEVQMVYQDEGYMLLTKQHLHSYNQKDSLIYRMRGKLSNSPQSNLHATSVKYRAKSFSTARLYQNQNRSLLPRRIDEDPQGQSGPGYISLPWRKAQDENSCNKFAIYATTKH